MKKLFASLVCLAMLASIIPAYAGSCCGTSCCTDGTCNTDCCDCCCCRTIFIPRSPGDNLVRQFMHGYNQYKYGEECFYGAFSVEYRYQRNFREERVANSLFGRQTLTFQGSKVTGRDDDNSILADYFGLSPEVNNSISFCPRIQNHIVDFQLFLGLNELWEGLYMQFNAPVTHSKWALRPGTGCSTTSTSTTCCSSSCCTSCGCSPCCCDSSCCSDSCCGSLPTPSSTTAFFPGYMDQVGTAPGTPVAAATTFTEALGGDFKFGDMQEAWKYGRFNFCEMDDTKLAGFHFNLGYNFYECPDYHFGVYLKVVAPTGTETGEDCAVYNVFYPYIGDNHWKFGGGITAHAELWNCDDESFINMYLQGYIVHLFDRCQLRSFDFKNKGCLSRYMLLKEFDPTAKTYSGKLINAINYTTRCVEVDVPVQGELALEFVYNNDCGFVGGLGYNLYGKSAEDICGVGTACDSTISGRSFGFKGCAPVEDRGYQASTGTEATSTIVLATTADRILRSTQSDATITKCGTTDASQTLYLAPTAQTAGFIYIDSALKDIRTVSNGDLLSTVASYKGTESSSTTLTVSSIGAIDGATNSPVLITTSDLDLCSGAVQSQISHKIFGHLGYEWLDTCWEPYVRVGAEVELASCSDCGTMNAWGIFVGGGITF